MMMMNKVVNTNTMPESEVNTSGLNNMPTDTKNKTVKKSRTALVSSSAAWFISVSLKIMPAKKAPKANDT